MKPLIIPALLIALSAAQSAHAGGGYDLQCLLENGEQMTLSHASDTVYISFEKPGGDAEEGDSVIKLDIPSGEAKQTVIAKSEAGTASFTLRGESDYIEGAVAVNYSEYDGTGDAYYTAMNSLGQETSTVSCKPGTINVSRSLLQNGINGVGSQQANKPASSQQQQVQQPTTPPSPRVKAATTSTITPLPLHRKPKPWSCLVVVLIRRNLHRKRTNRKRSTFTPCARPSKRVLFSMY